MCTFSSRIASDLTEYRDVGMATASSILQNHMKTVNFSLAPSCNAYQVKSALRLLTSMVTFGHITAREIISQFDFTQDFVPLILQRRSLDELPDVRSTYILFITAFLMEDDPVILRTLAENRAILQPLFDGLIYDTVGVLQIFVSTLRDKVALSTSLSKTMKMRIFNNFTNKLLANLFHWKGPQKPSKKATKEESKKEEALVESDAEILEDRIAVAELGQSLFLALTSSNKFGLTFADYSLGLGSESKNRAVLTLLQVKKNTNKKQRNDFPIVENIPI